MDNGAANYDPAATEDFKCFTYVAGCLHPKALNFNCSKLGTARCTDSVTNHSIANCQFYELTSSAGTSEFTANSAEIVMKMSGSSVPTTAQLAAIGLTFVDLGLPTPVMSVASRRQLEESTRGRRLAEYTVTATFPALTADQYTALEVVEYQYLGSVAGLQALLDSAGLTGFVAVSVSLTVQSDYTVPPPSAPPGADAGLIVGLVVGGVVLLLIIVGVFFFMKKRKGSGNVAPS
jgi:hypothetical protein